MKQISIKKMEKNELGRELEQLKNQIHKSYLKPFEEEFQQLDQENIQLRNELNQLRRGREDKS